MSLKIIPLLLLLLTASCKDTKESAPEKAAVDLDEQRISQLIGFFNANAYQPDRGTYYSEIDNEGGVVSEKIYNVALSRMIYGLAYASTFDTSYLDKAARSAAFQLVNLTKSDDPGKYFLSFYDARTEDAPPATGLDIWQQAYGLCGLSELYRVRPDTGLLAVIHAHHDDFVSRFHDKTNGGFYGNYDLKNGQISGSKSLQALVYPITAYMENLWKADAANRDKYVPYLRENLALAYTHGWNRDLGWVNIRFDDEWNACRPAAEDTPCAMVSPGHNFQYASLLLRAKNWDFLTPAEVKQYNLLGMEVLDSTLKKPIYTAGDPSRGFYSEVNPLTDQVTDYRKTWWQHCEALIALSLAGGEYTNEVAGLERFYFAHFVDPEYGGEYFYLDQDDQPEFGELKGGIGKSAYHTVEMIRFLRNP